MPLVLADGEATAKVAPSSPLDHPFETTGRVATG